MSGRWRCPECHRCDGLWEPVVVPGWRSLDASLRPRGVREVEWDDAERDSWASHEVGCSCGWEGFRDRLEAIGNDDEPLPPVIPGQLVIDEEPSA